MPPPLDPAKRAAVEADITAGLLSRNDIARRHDVSPGTVTKYARELEHNGTLTGPAFDRTMTADATRARAKDNAARRAGLVTEFLNVAEEELARRDAPVVWGNFGGKDNTYEEVRLERPTFGMRSTLVTTAARAAKAAADLEALSSDAANERSRSLLERLADGDIEVVGGPPEEESA